MLASEVTLILASATICLTAFAILLNLALNPSVTLREAYLAVVFTLSLQVLVSVVSWLLAQYVSEAVNDAQRAQELQFAQARFNSLRAQTETEHRQLLGGIAAIQSAIARSFGGDFPAQVELTDGALIDLAQSVNELLRHVEAAVRAERELERRDAAVPPLMEVISRMAEPGLPGPTSLPLKTDTPMDNVGVAVSQSQANIAHRISQVQKLAGEIAGAAGHSNDGLSTATEEVNEAKRLAGLLVSIADTILDATQKELDLVARTRRVLGTLLPEELARLTPDLLSSLDAEEAARLRGLAVDLGLSITGGAIELTPPPSNVSGTLAPPATRPLPAVEHERITTPLTAAQAENIVSAPAAAGVPGGGGNPNSSTTFDLPREIVDAWGMLGQIADSIGHEERSVSSLAHELGLLAATMRRVDMGVAWATQALETVRQGAEQLQRVMGTPPPPDLDDPRPAGPSRPNTPGAAPRMPPLSRPIAESVGTGPEASTLAELAGELGASDALAPGSLRASDLINLDDLHSSESGA